MARWLKVVGGSPAQVPPQARELLQLRLRVRVRASMVVSPLLVCVVGLLGWAVFHFPDPDRAGTERAYAIRFAIIIALLALAPMIANEAVRWRERRIGAGLANRVSRGQRVPVPVMLGRARVLYVIVAVTLEGALATELLWVHAAGLAWFRWVFIATFGLASVSAVLGIARAAARPTIAIDSVSLAFDERLRSEDAFSAAGSVTLAFGATGGLLPLDLPTWIGVQALGSWLVVVALEMWAGFSYPWPTKRTPTPTPTPAGAVQ